MRQVYVPLRPQARFAGSRSIGTELGHTLERLAWMKIVKYTENSGATTPRNIHIADTWYLLQLLETVAAKKILPSIIIAVEELS